MEKQDLKNLLYLHKEIARLTERIEELETRVTSTVKPLSDMPKGNGKPNYDVENLVDLKEKLKERKAELEMQKRDAELFIQNIEDSQTRLILATRYIDGMQWNEVAEFIGGGNTEDSVRMRADRYIN